MSKNCEKLSYELWIMILGFFAKTGWNWQNYNFSYIQATWDKEWYLLFPNEILKEGILQKNN